MNNSCQQPKTFQSNLPNIFTTYKQDQQFQLLLNIDQLYKMNSNTILVIAGLIALSSAFCVNDCTLCFDDIECIQKYGKGGWCSMVKPRCMDGTCARLDFFKAGCGDKCNFFGCNCEHCHDGDVKRRRRRRLIQQNSAKETFNSVDLNGDHEISMEEFETFWKKEYNKEIINDESKQHLIEIFNEMDDNNDGFIKAHEFDRDLTF